MKKKLKSTQVLKFADTRAGVSCAYRPWTKTLFPFTTQTQFEVFLVATNLNTNNHQQLTSNYTAIPYEVIT